MPSPEEPARVLLICIELGFDEVTEVVLVVRAQVGHSTSIFSIAATHIRAAGQSPIVAGSFAKPIEPFGAIGLRPCPFANDGPLVGASEFGAESASGSDMLWRGHSDFAGGEDLILMGIEHVIIWTRCVAIPDGNKVFESVVEGNDCVGVAVADSIIALVVEVLDAVKVEDWTKRLVQ